VRSVRRHIFRATLMALCGLFMVAAISGCTTTQETAELKQAESKRILERRDHRQKHLQAERAKGKKG
jgi:hypothetical protein